MTRLSSWLLLLAFPCLAAAFSVEKNRVFLSTPVSNWPKRLVGDWYVPTLIARVCAWNCRWRVKATTVPQCKESATTVMRSQVSDAIAPVTSPCVCRHERRPFAILQPQRRHTTPTVLSIACYEWRLCMNDCLTFVRFIFNPIQHEQRSPDTPAVNVCSRGDGNLVR